MTFATGLELANNTLAFAEHQNVELMAARGNQVVTGTGVTAQGTPDLTIAVASGTVLAGGVVVAVASGNIDLSATHGALTTGQAQFVFIHVNSSGTKSSTAGTAAVAGQQLPPDVPEDEVVLAQITLTEGDPTIDSVDIEDWRINVPKGVYVEGNIKIQGGTSPKIFTTGDSQTLFIASDANILIDIDANANQTTRSFTIRANGATSLFTVSEEGLIKNPLDNAGFHTGIGDDLRIYHDGTQSWIINNTGTLHFPTASAIFRLTASFRIEDTDDSFATLLNFDTTARTFAIGASADPVVTTIFSTLEINNQGAGADPQFTSNSVNQVLIFTGRFDPSVGIRLADSIPLELGTAADATIQYNGTDLLINPKSVGSGIVRIQGELIYEGLRVNHHNIFTDLGASVALDSGHPVVLIPSADADARVVWNFILPTGFDTTVTIHVRYSISTTNAKSGIWSVGTLTTGAQDSAQENNVLAASTAFDFPAGTGNQVEDLEIALNDADIVAGRIMHVSFQMDTSSSGQIRIFAIWLEKT